MKEMNMETTNLNKTNEEKLYTELTHMSRRARRFMQGEGFGPEDRPFHCGPGFPHDHPRRGHSGECPDSFSEKGQGGRHHGHGCPQDGPEGPGPERDPARPRHPHGHRPPVLSRERILTVLLHHETALEKEEQAAESAGLRQKQLTEMIRINASSMSEFIGHLEDDGYVERNVDPTDKRATLITLTEKGRARACELQDERKERLNQLFSPLTEEEQAELLRLLQKLHSR